MAEKIAIFGGTFDPIHMGHMIMAEYALSVVDKVCFLPNNRPPHKQNGAYATARQRLEMVKLAITGKERFCYSDYELKVKGPSYTVDTMEYFVREWKTTPCFMVGADSLRDITGWYQPERLRDLCEILAFDRVAEGVQVEERAEQLCREGWKITVVKMPLIELDSTTIRARIAAGLPISCQVPETVGEYINKNKLYL
ncbi:MAG: nicotinate (nicotinamide) nucleotide adenylyltransferase [Ruminococcaceae bacterium]|nr:nicotinate (nicotinamide) nucleotide adenylyltransferase [Oscillospiraceae bacterium]